MSKEALDSVDNLKIHQKRSDAVIDHLKIEVNKLKGGVEAQLPPNLLNDLEKYQNQVLRFSTLLESLQKGNEDKLRRLITLETEMRTLLASAKFLKEKKLETDTKWSE